MFRPPTLSQASSAFDSEPPSFANIDFSETSFDQYSGILERAPATLKRAGIGPLSSYIPYYMDNRHEFTRWWLTTNYGDKTRLGRKALNWESKRSSSTWDGFLQVAHEETGLPKALCQLCDTILEHPNWVPNRHTGNGTSGLIRHLQSNIHTRILQSDQPTIHRALTQMVSY
jgi:hypothetical protein